MIWTKGAHQSAKLQTFDCSRKISPNLYFDRLLKVYKISAKEVLRNYISWPWRLMQHLKKNWSVLSKMTRIWWNLTQALKSLKNLLLHCSYCAKYLMFDLKKHRLVIFHDTEEGCKIGRKTDLRFGKWQKYGKFSLEHLKFSKLRLWRDPLIQSRKSMSLKIYRGAKCHYNEEWCKTWRGIDLSFQDWHEEFDGFWLEQLKVSKTLTLMHSFWAKYILFELKKYRGVIFHDTEEEYKIWRGIDLSF